MNAETGGGLTGEERELGLTVEFDCTTCHHDYRRHYQQHDGCRTCTFDNGSSCSETMVSAFGKALAPAVDRILAARLADRDAALARVSGVLARAEQRQHSMDPRHVAVYVGDVRAALHPAPSEAP